MKPYTYLIGWTKQNMWYYGVQFGKNAHPNNLWNTYFTSSNKVKSFRKLYGEPDIIEIRKTFYDADKAREWETTVIRRCKLVESDQWLNQTDNTGKFFRQGPRGRFTDEHREKLAAAKRGRKISPEHARKLHEGRRNSKNSAEHIQRLKTMDRTYCKGNKWSVGRVMSEETKEKIRMTKLSKGGRG
jgi:NUMOD3 motif